MMQGEGIVERNDGRRLHTWITYHRIELIDFDYQLQTAQNSYLNDCPMRARIILNSFTEHRFS